MSQIITFKFYKSGTQAARQNQPQFLSSKRASDAFLVRHPAFLNKHSRGPQEINWNHNTQAIDQNAWRKQEPIRLKDFNGVEMVIPWRIARDWEVRQFAPH